jgi:nucleoside-diphosphate-sugar epimerase
MRILITGNMGYIGPVVVRYLRARHPEAELVGFDSGYFAHNLTGGLLLPECRLNRQIFGDVRSLPPEELKGVDAVVHLAAISNDPMGNRYEEVTLDINYRATIEVARKAKAAGVRSFVFASSCSVYGFAENGARDENSPLDPLTAYARSKVQSEQELAKLAGPDFQVTCLRFATACGMSERLRLDLVLNDFVASAIAAKRILILSDGTPWRPLIHVEDMARAIEWAIQRQGRGGECLVVNAGSNGWNYQVKALAQAVAEAIPGTEVSINRDAQPDRRSYQVDFTKFKELAPEHQPQVSLPEAIRGLREGLEGIRFSDAEFRKSNLIRLNTLSAHRAENRLKEDLRWTS